MEELKQNIIGKTLEDIGSGDLLLFYLKAIMNQDFVMMTFPCNDEELLKIVELNNNHLQGQITMQSLNSFTKHCLKYIFAIFKKDITVEDKSMLGVSLKKWQLEFITKSVNQQRTIKPDGNVLIISGVILVAILAWTFKKS